MGRFSSVIEDLQIERDRIDAALVALRALDAPPAPVSRDPRGTVTAFAVERINRGDAVAISTPSVNAGASTVCGVTEFVLRALGDGPKLKREIESEAVRERGAVGHSTISTALTTLIRGGRVMRVARGRYALAGAKAKSAPTEPPAKPQAPSRVSLPSMHDKTALLKTVLQVLRHGQKMDSMQIAIQATRLAGVKLTADDVMPAIAQGLETGDIEADTVGAEGHVRTVYAKKGAGRAID